MIKTDHLFSVGEVFKKYTWGELEWKRQKKPAGAYQTYDLEKNEKYCITG